MHLARSLVFLIPMLVAPCLAGEPELCIGDTEQVYEAAKGNTHIRGLAWDETSAENPQLLVLDASGILFRYELDSDELKLIDKVDLQKAIGVKELHDPRGLAQTSEEGKPIVYFTDRVDVSPRLWRYDLKDAQAQSVDLSRYQFRLGDREVFDLAHDGDALLICYDATTHIHQNIRVQRGILRVAWDQAFGDHPTSVEHLPDAGTESSHGVATMRLVDSDYLWATIGHKHIYCADKETGRGLFFFDRPPSEDGESFGLAFGQGALWVAASAPGADHLHRVNVTKNPNAPLVGPRVVRRLEMAITTTPEVEGQDAGPTYHYYSRPYGHDVLGNQGIWLDTETVADLSDNDDATIRELAQDPGGDTASRQIIQCVEYPGAPAYPCHSRYELDMWTNPYKKCVYPHRVDDDVSQLAGTDYLRDDHVLYNLSDTATYEAFIQRVEQYIADKYDIEPDMKNTYWAARNIVEYLQDNYYYPSPDRNIPATVDYDRGHYDANPANLKIELSNRPYDKTQIIACSGTSVMVTGATRHLGIPSRWLGTGTPRGPSDWDTNRNGLLDKDETASCTNGHRYTQVWLGSEYGWICFDATPSRPVHYDYDVPPPLQSQWRYMNRCAAGHREPNRIVFNVGSEFIEPMYRAFEYDPRLAAINNCGGDQRYNLQGRFEQPELWRLPRHRIGVRNLCFVTQIEVEPKGRDSQISWQLDGQWDRIPDTSLSISLQRRAGKRWKDVNQLVKQVPADAGSTTTDLSGQKSGEYRLVLRRVGDPETGGVSGVFGL
ncbi:transglutaminase-like domain-containing protein [Aeoliella sp.]|uniref:transglutaminase-like domain-containing protein n=1 Tax=Aeoliella sp. TaxID=2795800 RepID=UPI003CCBB59E